MIDFVNVYMPAYVELEPEAVRDTRTRLCSFIASGFPEIETSPSTVTGDLLVTPQAYTIAAIETGMDRFMSDLDLGNVANGVVYNCDFVSQYLGNFAAKPGEGMQASGVVRLVFSKNKDYVLDRSLRFAAESGVFSMYMPYVGPFKVYKAGTVLPDGENNAVLIDSGSDAWFADIPVVGNTGAVEVSAGSQMLVNRDDIPELGEITALVDFDPGEESYTIEQLAARTRKTIYSASLNSRTGAIRYVEDNCPFTDSVYAIRNGDREMIRAFRNPYGIAEPCLDVYVRSRSYVFTEEQRIRLDYNEETDTFDGPFRYTGQIYHFESITHQRVPDVDDLPHTITSYNNRGLGTDAAYTVYEMLTMSVQNAVDEKGVSLYDVETDADGTRYAVFTVRYQTDPMFRALHSAVCNPDVAPVNTSIACKGFIPVVIDRFEVMYVKKQGVLPLLDEARDAIKAYMAGLGAPDLYSDAEIARIMGEAGAHYTKGVNVKARVQWTVADRIQHHDGVIRDVPAYPLITTSAGLRVNYPAAPSTQYSTYACSPRNVRYYFMEGALTFKEVKEV